MRFKFTINGTIFYANMVDNPLVKQIAEMCPFEQDYHRYTEHEYYTRLPKPTDERECKHETFARKNEIWYFGGWNAFTILFGDCDTSPFQVVKLGEMVEDVVPELKDAGSSLKIKCEVDL